MAFQLPEWKYLKDDIRDWWSRIYFRKWINNNPKIIILLTNLSVIIFIIVIYVMFKPNGESSPQTDKAWYFDLNTGELFVADSDLTTPIAVPSGSLASGEAAGVKAYVFSYVKDPNESQRFVGFLEKTDPNYVNSKTIEGIAKWGEGKLIKRIGDKRWYSATSKEGKEILKHALAPNINGDNPNQVSPQ